LGRWHVQDPLLEKYYPLSPYNYVANNPTKLIDPNGEDIWIYYKEKKNVYYKSGEKKGQFKKTKTVTRSRRYTIGMNGVGNKFADAVINSLNAIHDNLKDSKSDFKDIVKQIATDPKMKLSIKEVKKVGSIHHFSDRADPRKPDVQRGKVYWNSSAGFVGDIFNPESGSNRMPPILTLAHELGHAFFDFNGIEFNDIVEEDDALLPLERQLSKSMDYGARSEYLKGIKGIYRAQSPISTKGKHYKKGIFGRIRFNIQYRKFLKGK